MATTFVIASSFVTEHHLGTDSMQNPVAGALPQPPGRAILL